MKKALKVAAALILTAAVSACGQGYEPGDAAGVPTVEGGDDVFDSNGDDTVYKTASYEVLRYTLTNTMKLGEAIAPRGLATVCGAGITAQNCPKAAPVQYIDANRASLGTAVYNQEDPLATQAPGPMSSGGYKVWVLAASSACGRMMNEQAAPALFPNGVADYTHMYNVLLGRAPTGAEIEVLNALRNQALINAPSTASLNAKQTSAATAATPDQVQGAAVCTAVLGSLEFLTVN
jgi:hypothetical protein